MYDYLERAKQELNNFEKLLLESTATSILEKAYELTVKREFLVILETEDLSNGLSTLLSTLPYPLEFLYQEWLSSSYTGTEVYSQFLRVLGKE